ncbi:adhesion G protein-coupled receptor B1-like [Hydractinia symbiolongicarpus]|uniref:adhesion G protein-coupled receptor B1-like n=1 Tax=Hydractinia symbiolongicarpus TaxID=13093 RepID=UPI00254E1B84|nr:adhesion G protein-coupled receptor B1-like [Hydractinia symbiolongicarpus]
MTRNCSVHVTCPGTLTQWSAYGICSSTCHSASHVPFQQRTRSCVGATFGGNCFDALLNETFYCNLNVACPGKYLCKTCCFPP